MHADSSEHLQREMKRTLSETTTSSPTVQSPRPSKSAPRMVPKKSVKVKEQHNARQYHRPLTSQWSHAGKQHSEEYKQNVDNFTQSTNSNKNDYNNNNEHCSGQWQQEEQRVMSLTSTNRYNANTAKQNTVQVSMSSLSEAWVHPLDAKLHDILLCLTPTERQQRQRLCVLCDVQRALHSIGLTIAIYGSLRTGLLIPSSDIDCVMMSCDDKEGIHRALITSEVYESKNWREDEYERGHYPSYSHYRRNSYGEDSLNDEQFEPRNNNHSHYKNKMTAKMPNAVCRAIQSSNGLLEVCHSTRERQSACARGIRAVANAIRASRLFRNIFTIAHARVPIVKCEHRTRSHNVKVDLSFERDGCTTSQFLCEEFTRPGNEFARALTILVKSLIAEWQLDDPSCGGLGSFPTAMMVLWYLRHEVPHRVPLELQRSIGVLLSGFLHYYGNIFDFTRNGIDYMRQCTFSKAAAAELYIVNPIRPGTNCAKAATLFANKVIPQFKCAAQTFMNLLNHHTGTDSVHGAGSSSSNNNNNNNDAKIIENTLNKCFRRVLPNGQQWSRIAQMAEHTRQRYRQRELEFASRHDTIGKTNSEKDNNILQSTSLQHSWDEETKMYTGVVADFLFQ